MSYCPSFNNSFSGLFFTLLSHIWMKVGRKLPYEELQIKSTFVTVDLLFHELLPFLQNSFSGLFFTLLSHILMKVGRKLPFEELQIKFYFRHGWPTFSWVIGLCLQFAFQPFIGYDFIFLNESWYQAILTVIYWIVHRNNGCWFKFVVVGGGPVLL